MTTNQLRAALLKHLATGALDTKARLLSALREKGLVDETATTHMLGPVLDVCTRQGAVKTYPVKHGDSFYAITDLGRREIGER